MTERRILMFDCAGETLVGTLDDAGGATGLLIVTGGNEVRVGAHRGMALLAGRLAASGVAVFRYDRRGVGDSGGDNAGFAGSHEDLIAAAAAFRAAAPSVERIVGFGNCDAATTLAWWGREAGCDAVVLANPWVVAKVDDLPPPAAIKAHYAARLRDPAAWWQVIRGGFSVTKLVRGVRSIASPPRRDDLASRTLDAIAAWGDAATVVLAAGDATAIAYADAANRHGLKQRTVSIDTGSHSFARAGDAAALEAAIRSVINARG
ncbi:hydrolase 1, exosortase A system-associated [Sphingomonas radiodurans]|uniref:hydrolase 1, exosortase A system-associated n=1 Tax=Sphingomonas radiodurans TaxID=2890321 RepID=UPI001E2EED11|nr:hydrolase 1, exosortase A system-associated [Sphingomonas radiodurans]WBH16269.1 hydrolase 1, exosortase A system-associated [Sphingomonas radiodurans]